MRHLHAFYMFRKKYYSIFIVHKSERTLGYYRNLLFQTKCNLCLESTNICKIIRIHYISVVATGNFLFLPEKHWKVHYEYIYLHLILIWLDTWVIKHNTSIRGCIIKDDVSLKDLFLLTNIMPLRLYIWIRSYISLQQTSYKSV